MRSTALSCLLVLCSLGCATASAPTPTSPFRASEQVVRDRHLTDNWGVWARESHEFGVTVSPTQVLTKHERHAVAPH